MEDGLNHHQCIRCKNDDFRHETLLPKMRFYHLKLYVAFGKFWTESYNRVVESQDDTRRFSGDDAGAKDRQDVPSPGGADNV